MQPRVLLINPPYDIQRYMGGLGKIGWVFPPMGLLYIAAYLRKAMPEARVDLYDCQVETRDFWGLMRETQPNIVGITCQSALVYSTLQLAEDIKGRYPDTTVVVGGVHVNIRPDDLLRSPHVDYVVQGEGEVTFTELCAALSSGGSVEGMPGVCHKDAAGALIHNSERPLIKDLDTIPRPALDLIPLAKYRVSPDLRTGDRFGMVLTSRGCPHNCAFCANILLTKRTYRTRSIQSVLDEIDYYIEHIGIDQLMVFDENFGVNRRRAMELCDAFIDKGYPQQFSWWAEMRVDDMDEELLTKMKTAGCSILSFGLESGVQRLLDLIDKRTTLEQIEEATHLIRKVGLRSRASAILGLPTETRAESLQTISFAYRLPLDLVRFAIATPFPGTRLWDIAVAEGKLDPDNVDWTRLSLMGGYADHDPPYYPEGRTPGEIKRLQRRANFFFFLRPRIILAFLRRIRSLSDMFRLWRGFVRFARASA